MSQEAIGHLRAALEALRAFHACDLDTLTESEIAEVVSTCPEVRGAFEAGEAKYLARWDSVGMWRADGARSAAAALAHRQHLPIQVARQRLRHGRAARDLPALDEAWAAGELDRSHVTTLLNTRTPRTAAAFERDHEVLVHGARTRGFIDFKRICDRWAQQADPDGAEDASTKDIESRELHLSQSFGGMWFGKLTLDPLNGTIVANTLREIERELFDAERAEAKARLGRDPMVFELPRTPAQRRADALVEMAGRARTAPPGGKRPAPLFTVLVDWETLHGPLLELANRTAVTPGAVAGWLDGADLERVVFDAESRVIDVGVTRRLFSDAQRRAVYARDRTCFDPTCDELPDRPQIDHIRPYSQGGETTLDNARLACAFHNRARNHQGPAPPGC